MTRRIERLRLEGDLAVTAHELMLAAYAEEAALIGAERFPPLERTLRDLVTSATALYGAREDDCLLGIIEVSGTERDRGLNIDSLCVSPAHRRRGVGGDLVRHVVAISGGRPITVSTAAANEPAIALYLAVGFLRCRESGSSEGIALVHFRLESPGAAAPGNR